MPSSAQRPVNMLIFMSDEHNPFYSSVYGHPFIQTPNMERLAAMGTVYENTYCPSPLCMPSRSAFVAGRRVHEIQAYSNCNAFPFDYPSYGGILSGQGVHSVHIGKMDVYNETATLGFSEAIHAGDRQQPGDWNISRRPLKIRTGAEERANGYGPREGAFGYDNAMVEAALEWLRGTAPGLDQPWTLAVNTGAPHFPHFTTRELWDLYPQGGDLPAYGMEESSAQHPYAQDLRAHFQTEGFTEEQVGGLRRGYLGCVTHVDRLLGRLLEALQQTGLLEDTVVAYSSDHGEMLGTFGMWWKCSLYEDSVRVPLIVAGPGFDRGARVKTPVDLLDLQASFFAATGARRPAAWSGTPLQEIPVDDLRRVVFSEYHGHGTRASAYLVRKGKWKYLHYCAGPHQLFDLESDPHELRNLIDRRPDIARQLERELRRICDPEAENERAEDLIARQLESMQESGFDIDR